MYYDFTVPIPDVKGKITFMKKGDAKCILRCPAAVVAVSNSRRAVSNRSVCEGNRSVNCCAV